MKKPKEKAMKQVMYGFMLRGDKLLWEGLDLRFPHVRRMINTSPKCRQRLVIVKVTIEETREIKEHVEKKYAGQVVCNLGEDRLKDFYTEIIG